MHCTIWNVDKVWVTTLYSDLHHWSVGRRAMGFDWSNWICIHCGWCFLYIDFVVFGKPNVYIKTSHSCSAVAQIDYRTWDNILQWIILVRIWAPAFGALESKLLFIRTKTYCFDLLLCLWFGRMGSTCCPSPPPSDSEAARCDTERKGNQSAQAKHL